MGLNEKNTSLLNELPKVADSDIICDEFFKIKRERLKIPNQEDYNYYTLMIRPIAVMVLPITDEGLYVINREYRHPAGSVLLSCPGGAMHEKEDPIACAERELMEETGYHAAHFEKFGESYPFPGVCGQKTVFIRAKGAYRKRDPNLEHAELIETRLYSKQELFELVQRGDPIDGLLCTALFFATQQTAGVVN